MATTSQQIQTFKSIPPAGQRLSTKKVNWLARRAAREEARILFAMICRGNDTIESVRALIAVPPKTEEALRLYAQQNPDDSFGVEGMLRFRQRVAESFESLVRGVPRSTLTPQKTSPAD